MSQNLGDALTLTLKEGMKKSNVASIREVISLLEAQGHDCTDVKAKVTKKVQFTFK